jgi:hypothetical protein
MNKNVFWGIVYASAFFFGMFFPFEILPWNS